MFGLENRGETLIFMSLHFDKKKTKTKTKTNKKSVKMKILISHFLYFGVLKF